MAEAGRNARTRYSTASSDRPWPSRTDACRYSAGPSPSRPTAVRFSGSHLPNRRFEQPLVGSPPEKALKIVLAPRTF